ncbi:tail fiber domain-containing protein, partial [Acetobacter sp. DsW_059]
PFSGAVLQSAVQVVSDANDKTIIGTIGTSDFTAETTKLRAAWAAISGVVYTLNFSTNATKRNHIGVIAQTVQAAFTAQGLDPSDYGLWCSTPKTKAVTSTVDGVTTTTEEPVYEADGKTQAT